MKTRCTEGREEVVAARLIRILLFVMSGLTPAQIRIKEVLLVISKGFCVMEQIATHHASA